MKVRTKPLYGWKPYTLHEDARCLVDNQDNVWHYSVMKMWEGLCGHELPALDCTCGIGGIYDLSGALQYGQIVGFCRAMGYVALHEAGWRAERVQVLALVASEEDKRKLRVLPAWADVPVYSLREVLSVKALIDALCNAVPANTD